MPASCAPHGLNTRKSDVTNGLQSASSGTFLEKPVESFNPTPAT
ncbi:hypothetical protein [Pseudomonas sp. RGM2987]|nr:hypothetical protein [Pseudomonas sp. RGM2987]